MAWSNPYDDSPITDAELESFRQAAVAQAARLRVGTCVECGETAGIVAKGMCQDCATSMPEWFW